MNDLTKYQQVIVQQAFEAIVKKTERDIDRWNENERQRQEWQQAQDDDRRQNDGS